MRRLLLPVICALMVSSFLYSCGGAGEKATRETQNYGALGDSIAQVAQQTLLSRVTGAIAEGGPSNAVSLCNIEAIPLTDSISTHYNVSIHRVSDKNRNRGNNLVEGKEQELFEALRDSLAAGRPLEPHYLIESENGAVTFYKPIVLGMPTCLKCHGMPGTDIDDATLEVLKEKYPDDKATGYTLGQLRGLWKITFN